MPDRRKFLAYAVPFVVFVLLLGLGAILERTSQRFLHSSSEYWIYPAQTIVCGALLIWFWREYRFQPPRGTVFAVTIGVLVCFLWVAPQAFLGWPARTVGFDPDILVQTRLFIGRRSGCVSFGWWLSFPWSKKFSGEDFFFATRSAKISIACPLERFPGYRL